jgi:hypothetical protein
MLDEKIVVLKEKLNNIIINENNYEEIYKISSEIDDLIIDHYSKNL